MLFQPRNRKINRGENTWKMGSARKSSKIKLSIEYVEVKRMWIFARNKQHHNQMNEHTNFTWKTQIGKKDLNNSKPNKIDR